MFVVRNIAELHTMDDELGRIERAAVVAADDMVTWVGPEKDLPQLPVGTPQMDAEGGAALPGLVECHTHLVFAGDRVRDYVRRARGDSYAQIAAEGGGILTTVKATRAAAEDALVDLALPRLRALLSHGVTTCEVKSGYGLTFEDELKILRAIRILSALQPVELIPTLLGAHTTPAEFRDRQLEYVKLVADRMVPEAAAKGLAKFVDVFVEKSAFTPEHARIVAESARAHGLGVKLHVDQLSSGKGAELAAELRATSADHLDHTTDEGIAALKSSSTTAVLLPTAQVFLGHSQTAPARKLVEAGVPVAISSDFNPGTSPCAHVPLAGTLAVGQYKLTTEEALRGLTRNAALAVGRGELGRIRVGAPCDLVILRHAMPEALLYEMAGNAVNTVVKAGRVAWRRPLVDMTR